MHVQSTDFTHYSVIILLFVWQDLIFRKFGEDVLQKKTIEVRDFLVMHHENAEDIILAEVGRGK